jgi:hypothetical protein
VVAPASMATSQTLTRKSGSVRVASSGENSTSSAVAAGEGDGFGDLVDGLLAGDLELGGEVEVGGGEEGVDAAAGGGLDGTGGGLDVLALAAGEGGDDGATYFAGDGADGGGVAVGGDGEAGLEDVDAERGELVGHAEFFGVVHGAAGGLLAVAQGGVEEEDAVWVGGAVVYRDHGWAPVLLG